MEGKGKKMTTGVVVSQLALADDIFSMWIRAEEIAKTAIPGQFLAVYPKDPTKLLPRPISICETDRASGTVRMVYRVAGEGTREFSRYRENEEIRILGPLGNGYDIDQLQTAGKVLLIGGGIGIPPMLGLARALQCEKEIVLGYRDVLFLKEEFETCGPVAVATEDGSAGTRGNVLDAIREHAIKADVICACGPTPMLRALKAYAGEQQIRCWLSLEERMACGIGACLACVCKTGEIDEHSHVKNKRICKDGPVFDAREVEL